jgi:hypothetical protein
MAIADLESAVFEKSESATGVLEEGCAVLTAASVPAETVDLRGAVHKEAVSPVETADETAALDNVSTGYLFSASAVEEEAVVDTVA